MGRCMIVGGSAEKGEPGKAGADGFSPVATITETEDGAIISITDASGKTSAKIKNGNDGTSGSPGIVISNTEPTDESHPVWINPKGSVWTKVIDIEIEEKVTNFEASDLNGATEFHIKWSALQNDSTTNSGLDISINGVTIGAYGLGGDTANSNSTPKYGWTHLKYDGLFWVIEKSQGAISSGDKTSSTMSTVYNLVDNVHAADVIRLGTSMQIYAPVSGHIEVWAK